MTVRGHALALIAVASCGTVAADDTPIAQQPSDSRAADGSYISWVEHRIDDSELGGLELTGSDGLVMADLDGDGFEDVVSVHESDTVYDGKPIGHVRIAWGSSDPDRWQLTTLAEGHEAAGAEDVSVADANGDGYLDVIVAAELAHLVYFENPAGPAHGGLDPRTTHWPRTIPPITQDRGSYIRVFFADFDGDGMPEVVAPNKGAQSPDPSTAPLDNLSVYHLPAEPLRGDMWQEQLLARVRIPINSEPVDLDLDGDLDVVAGSRAETRLLWFENQGDGSFVEHAIERAGGEDAIITGFNMDYADLNGDGRLDIVATGVYADMRWLEAPESWEQPWATHLIGSARPDQLVSACLADIDGDGDLDVFSGSYSLGTRDRDSASTTDPLGRIVWFENPGTANVAEEWRRHDISRRQRGMFDKWIARDMDHDGDLDFVGTRGNSEPNDGVIWLEQVRSHEPRLRFTGAFSSDSADMPLP